MTATYAREVTCPFCGERIRLADCPIVATNRYAADELRLAFHQGGRPAAPAAPVDLGEDFSTRELASLIDDEDDEDEVQPAPRRAAQAFPPPAPHVPTAGGGRFAPGTELVSRVDRQARIVVAAPPEQPRPPEGRRTFRSPPVHPLPSPVDLAREHGGSRVRPARACPRPACFHPLPNVLDVRDPFVVGLVGNTGASKTTLLAALVDLAERKEGQEALGLIEFSMLQRTAKGLRPIVKRFQKGESAILTQVASVQPPLEFAATLAAFPNQPIVLLLHDMPGEVYMDEDDRAIATAHLMWADALVFVTNPEEAPGIDLLDLDARDEHVDQATVLNGIHEDLGARGSSPQHATYPPLVMAVSKADVLQEEGVLGLDGLSPESIRKALRAVGADDVLSAADRWPVTHWVAVAPMPDHGPAIGVADLFRTVLSVMTDPHR